MHIRGVLFVVACIAAQGCSKDKAADPAAKSDPKGSGSATNKRDGLELAQVPEAVSQPVTARTAVLIAKDGSLSVAEIDAGVVSGLAIDSIKGEPVAQLADLPARLSAIEPPPPEEPEELPGDDDDQGGAGTAMMLEEGKMGKKDSDRAEGQYKMKNNNADPNLAREQALEEARKAGILGTIANDPCNAGAFTSITGTGDFTDGFDDADIYGGLLGNEPGEMSGGWGYGVGAGGGGGGYVVPAGLRARSAIDNPMCGWGVPLVIADARATAARVVEVLSVFPSSQLAVSVDGTHALTLAAEFWYRAGNRPAALETPEIGFTLGPDGPRGSAYRGTREDATVWSWDGKSGGIADALLTASEVTALRAAEVRIRVDGDVKVGTWIEGISVLLVGQAQRLAFGDPLEFEHEPIARGGMRGRSASTPAVRIGQPTATGNFDKAILRRYIKRNLPKIRYCYEKQLLVKPDLQGTIDTQFVIAENGTVKSIAAKGVDPDVSSCVAGVIKAIDFPKPKGGGVIDVTSYPFEFHPTGG